MALGIQLGKRSQWGAWHCVVCRKCGVKPHCAWREMWQSVRAIAESQRDHAREMTARSSWEIVSFVVRRLAVGHLVADVTVRLRCVNPPTTEVDNFERLSWLYLSFFAQSAATQLSTRHAFLAAASAETFSTAASLRPSLQASLQLLPRRSFCQNFVRGLRCCLLVRRSPQRLLAPRLSPQRLPLPVSSSCKSRSFLCPCLDSHTALT